jgi:hypothetical protein
VKELQTLALGLVIVFVDVSTPDWVADPIGWVLVLVALAAVRDRLPDHGQVSLAGWTGLALAVVTWPESSVAHLDGWLELLFSLPVLVFCFLLCDSLRDVTVPAQAGWFRLLCWVFAGLVLAPAAIYGLEWEWMATPTTVLTVAANLALVLVLISASDEDAVLVPADGEGDSSDSSDGSGTSDSDASDDREDHGKHRA